MRLQFVFGFLPLLLGLCRASDCYGVSGVFDFYVLRQEWPATFCSNNTQNHPLCENPTDFMRANLTLHGLWPSYTSERDGHAWPQCCPSPWGPTLNGSVVDQWLPQLLQLWPDADTPTLPYNRSAFWQHEYSVHGVCSGLAPSDYLGAALHQMASLATPPIFNLSSGVGSIQLQSLYDGYNATACSDGSEDGCWVAIGCTAGGWVNGVTTCWTRKTFEQIYCPPIVLQQTTKDTRTTGDSVACQQPTVTLPAFP